MNDEYNQSIDDILAQLSQQKHTGAPKQEQSAQPAQAFTPSSDFAAAFAQASAQKSTVQPTANASQSTIVIGPAGNSEVHIPDAGLDVSKYKPEADKPLFDNAAASFKAFFPAPIASLDLDDEPKKKQNKGGFLCGLVGKIRKLFTSN